MYQIIMSVLSLINILFFNYKEYEDAKFLYEKNMNINNEKPELNSIYNNCYRNFLPLTLIENN